MKSDPQEPLPVVDEHDRPIGTAPRWRVHAEGLLHRAVHVLLFDRRGRLYLQMRSAEKDTHPRKWTSSASGHVDPGEGYDEAAARELGEELGLSLPLTPLGRLDACPATEGEFVAVYTAVSDAPPRPDRDEIERGDFFTLAEARALAADLTVSAPSLDAVLALLPD